MCQKSSIHTHEELCLDNKEWFLAKFAKFLQIFTTRLLGILCKSATQVLTCLDYSGRKKWQNCASSRAHFNTLPSMLECTPCVCGWVGGQAKSLTRKTGFVYFHPPPTYVNAQLMLFNSHNFTTARTADMMRLALEEYRGSQVDGSYFFKAW